MPLCKDEIPKTWEAKVRSFYHSFHNNTIFDTKILNSFTSALLHSTNQGISIASRNRTNVRSNSIPGKQYIFFWLQRGTKSFKYLNMSGSAISTSATPKTNRVIGNTEDYNQGL